MRRACLGYRRRPPVTWWRCTRTGVTWRERGKCLPTWRCGPRSLARRSYFTAPVSARRIPSIGLSPVFGIRAFVEYGAGSRADWFSPGASQLYRPGGERTLPDERGAARPAGWRFRSYRHDGRGGQSQGPIHTGEALNDAGLSRPDSTDSAYAGGDFPSFGIYFSPAVRVRTPP